MVVYLIRRFRRSALKLHAECQAVLLDGRLSDFIQIACARAGLGLARAGLGLARAGARLHLGTAGFVRCRTAAGLYHSVRRRCRSDGAARSPAVTINGFDNHIVGHVGKVVTAFGFPTDMAFAILRLNFIRQRCRLAMFNIMVLFEHESFIIDKCYPIRACFVFGFDCHWSSHARKITLPIDKALTVNLLRHFIRCAGGITMLYSFRLFFFRPVSTFIYECHIVFTDLGNRTDMDIARYIAIILIPIIKASTVFCP